jgi:ABC-type multidrug transport system fused ATPase/permease subunit
VKRGKGETLEMQPIPSEEKKMHGLSSIFLDEGSDIVGLGIKFNSIGYRIKSGKNIISEISGSAQDASLLGIMGPSGSGKCEYF